MVINLESSNLNLPQQRGVRLRMLRKMSGLTIHKLAKKYAVGSSTIKYWECGRGEGLSVKGAEKMIMAVRQEGVYATIAWLMHGIGDNPRIVDMRQSTTTRQITTMSIKEEEAAITNETNLFKKNANAITLTITDDGMNPIYSIGDIVGGNCLTGLDINKALGKNCIVETEDKKLLCRKLMLKGNSDFFVLCSLNPRTTANPTNLWDVKIRSAAPISRIWKHINFTE